MKNLKIGVKLLPLINIKNYELPLNKFTSVVIEVTPTAKLDKIVLKWMVDNEAFQITKDTSTHVISFRGGYNNNVKSSRIIVNIRGTKIDRIWLFGEVLCKFNRIELGEVMFNVKVGPLVTYPEKKEGRNKVWS